MRSKAASASDMLGFLVFSIVAPFYCVALSLLFTLDVVKLTTIAVTSERLAEGLAEMFGVSFFAILATAKTAPGT